MKHLLLLLSIGLVLSTFAQPERVDVASIGYIEVKFKDSSEVWAMMWDDFTFEFDENHSEIIVVEGGSNKRIKYKAKNIDFVQFLNFEKEVTMELIRYKSPRGRDHLLLDEAHENGEYKILKSPNFISPVFYYLAYKGEVFSLLPTQNHDFLNFFSCEKLYKKYGEEDNHELVEDEMIKKLDVYLNNCLSPDKKKKEEVLQDE